MFLNRYSLPFVIIISILIGAILFYFSGTNILGIFKDGRAVTTTRQRANPTFPPIPTSVTPTDAYTIILVGDSMTQYLGPNSDLLRKHLKEHYSDENATPKGKVFGIFNYGFGSTNVLSLQDRLENETSFMGQGYQAILKREFDLVLIESFGNNPLSEFPLKEGLQKQDEALTKAVISIHEKHPKAVIAFYSTISPLRDLYAKGTVDLSIEKRREWADERIAYMKNHIKFAKDHNIPYINIYEDSLKDGEPNPAYINTNDYIHPSPAGVDFISKEISEWIFNKKVLPTP